MTDTLLEGCLNFRDLGGYDVAGGARTRHGRLYRSDSLHRLTELDVEIVVQRLGLTDAIDLRTATERERAGVLDERLGIRVHHLSALDGAMNATPETRIEMTTLAEGYVAMLERGASVYAAAIERMVASDGAAAFFCTAGKDRTGLLAAVVLGLVGVADDDIALDYSRTFAVIDAVRARIAEEMPEMVQRWASMPVDVMSASGETMLETLAHVRDRWGGLDGYAAHAGVGDGTVKQLRDQLVDPLTARQTRSGVQGSST